MISVIYCTREPNPKHTEHIKKTSGVKAIEVIEIVNNGEPITKAYNRGIKQATNDIIVLCHDDIILSEDWAKKIIKHFNTTDYGILGVAGTTRLAENGVWWQDRHLMVGCVKHSHNGRTWESRYSYSNGIKEIDVVLVDGLFIAINKTKIKKDFDENYDGFHFYDVTFCIRNKAEGVRIGVIFDVHITHKSIGMVNESWEKNRQQFVLEYGNIESLLPYEIKPTTGIQLPTNQVSLKKEPKVGIIIPTKSKLNLLFDCVDSILSVSKYKNYEIYIADTGSSDEELAEIRNKYSSHQNIKLIEFDYYNFASINNEVVNNYLSDDVEILLFCNNDIKLINDALTRMVNAYQKDPKCGTVGCRLHFADDTIQHAGVVVQVVQVQPNNFQYHITHKGLKSYYNYYEGTQKNTWGCTGAFLMISKRLFNLVGQFTRTSECFEDVILNLQTTLKGYNNYYVGEAVCYHLESQTRNEDPDKIKRTVDDYNKYVAPILHNNRNVLFKT
jgi:GT2 family glycosyltransferase